MTVSVAVAVSQPSAVLCRQKERKGDPGTVTKKKKKTESTTRSVRVYNTRGLPRIFLYTNMSKSCIKDLYNKSKILSVKIEP